MSASRHPGPRTLRSLLVVALVVGLLLLLRERPSRGITVSGPTMGTSWSVKAVYPEGVDEEETARSLQSSIQALLDRMNGVFSTYDPDSELSRLNAHVAGEAVEVSPDLLAVLVRARGVSEMTDGAFDVTVGPIVNAYGFGPDRRRPEPPTEAELRSLRERVGYRLVEIDETASTVRKARDDVYCDLSAIAKGYAVDRVAELLEAGTPRPLGYMVEVGGEVRVAGRSSRGGPWRIGAERPVEGGRVVQRVLEMSGGAVATSGDYRNFYLEGGERVSHTIDPRTGRPVRHSLASVSVLHEECALADALATALLVLGPDEGYHLAERERIACLLMVRRDDGSFEERATEGFPPAAPARTPGAR